MIETAVIQNSALEKLISIHPSLRMLVTLRELRANELLHRFQIYFPTTAVAAAVSDAEGFDLALVHRDECTWMAPYNVTFWTRTPGYAYSIPRLALRVPELQHVLSTCAAELHCRAIDTLTYRLHHSISCQVAHYLTSFHANDLSITQQVIANALGVRREGVTECIGDFVRRGLLSHSRSRISILDFEALLKLVFPEAWSGKESAASTESEGAL